MGYCVFWNRRGGGGESEEGGALEGKGYEMGRGGKEVDHDQDQTLLLCLRTEVDRGKVGVVRSLTGLNQRCYAWNGIKDLYGRDSVWVMVVV